MWPLATRVAAPRAPASVTLETARAAPSAMTWGHAVVTSMRLVPQARRGGGEGEGEGEGAIREWRGGEMRGVREGSEG